jgi:hypothetical protein
VIDKLGFKSGTVILSESASGGMGWCKVEEQKRRRWESGMVAIEGDLQRLKRNRMDEEEGRVVVRTT